MLTIVKRNYIKYLLVFLLSFLAFPFLYAEDDFEFNGYRGDIYDNYGNFRICDPLTPDRSRYMYAILHMSLTDTDDAMEDLPRYLRIALKTHEESGEKSNNYFPVLRYIKYPEMKKLIALIYFDAVDTKAGQAGKWDFIEELTGYLFTQDGVVLIDDEGNLQRRRTRYDDLFNLNETDMAILTQSLLDGCYNKDPRIRLTCLAVLEGIGPHPMMKSAIINGIKLESIGDMYENFPFDARNVRKYRHRFANINGCEEDDIPYRRFSAFERKISRVELCYHIEKLKDVTPDDFKTMSSPLFVTLTDNISDNPFFPPYYDNETSEDDYYIPTDIYMKKEGVFKYLQRNCLIPFTGDNVKSMNEETKTAYASVDNKLVIRVNSKSIPKEGEEDNSELGKEDFIRIVDLFIAGLENKDYTIRQKSATFLSKIYNYPEIDDNLRLYILQKVRALGYNLDMDKNLNEIPKKTIKVRER